MTRTEFLKRLCEGYVRCYRTLGLHTSAKWTDHTQRELNFFARAGEMLGFAARLEDKRMDLSWHDIDSKEKELVLYLERERDADKVFLDTFPKLLQSEHSWEARFLAAVLGWVRVEDLPRIKQEILSHLGDRSLFVLAWVGPNADTANRLEALVFSESSVHVRPGVGQKDDDGYWYARFCDGWKQE